MKGAWGLGARSPVLPLPLSLSQGREQTEEMLRPVSWPISHVTVMEGESPGWAPPQWGTLASAAAWWGHLPRLISVPFTTAQKGAWQGAGSGQDRQPLVQGG